MQAIYFAEIELEPEELAYLSNEEGWDLTYCQFQPGRFQGTFLAASSRYITINRESFSRRLHIVGTSPNQRMIFGIPLYSETTGRLNNYVLSRNRLSVATPGNEVEYYNDPNHDFVTIYVDLSKFQETVSKLELECDDNFIHPVTGIDLSDNTACRLRKLVHQFIYSTENPLDTYDLEDTEAQLLLLLSEVYADHFLSKEPAISNQSDREKYRKRALAYILPELHNSMSVADVCAAAGVSQRTLQYTFQHAYGMTIVEFVKVQRLNSVRRLLKQGDASDRTIAEIAKSCGINHQGRFASEYKDLFGEHPRDTIRF